MDNENFLPSADLINLLLKAQRPGAQRLDANSRNCPYGKPFDVEQARFAVGEKLILAIAVVSYKYDTRILIANHDGEFVQELKDMLADRLYLVGDYQGILKLLGQEFYGWIQFQRRLKDLYIFDKLGNLYTDPPSELLLGPIDE